MAYNEQLVSRVRNLVSNKPGYSERKMFGGMSFIINGNMACGVNEDNLVVRVGPDAYQEALGKPHAKAADMTGRSIKGWVTVEPAGLTNEQDLLAWVDRGVSYASSLPPK